MYGYVVVNKPELKFKEYDEYRTYYCGLCNSLKNKYGFRAQLSLTYDFTFLGLLLSALYEPQEVRKKNKCVIHPFSAQCTVSNKYIDYIADMTILLTWYKCEDDWNDEKKLVRKVYRDSLNKAVVDIRKKYKEKADIIEICMKNITAAEKRNEKNIDIVAGYFGKILAEIMAVNEDIWEESLRIIGNNLGKYIYILDAYDDLEKDIKNGNYNPLISRKDRENFEEEVRDILKMCAAPCAAEFEKLPIVNNISILRNIIYSGIWTKYETVSEKRKSKNGSV